MRLSAATRWLPILLLCVLSGCGGGGRHHPLVTAGTGIYRAPGPPEDPWGPYIGEAASRFDVPERWIRAVMRQESGGRQYLHGQPITSDAGAAGLMQLMPATYAELRDRYGLGDDPYDPHDNIMAGSAYIKELYGRYGAPAFLAAYDAGPRRVDDYMAGRSALPNETVNYLAAVSPALGSDRPLSGPLAAYADAGGPPLRPDPVPQAYARAPIAQCWRDPDAAYDPDAPCRSAPQAIAAAPPSTYRRASTPCWHDPNLAYDPAAPCQAPPMPPPMPPPVQVAEAPNPSGWGQGAPAPQAAWQPPLPPAPPAAVQVPQRYASTFLIPSAAAATLRTVSPPGDWAIQVGAFADPGLARRTADAARALAPRELAQARIVLGQTTPFGGNILYRARLAGLTQQMAANACSLIAAQQQACVTVAPGL